MSWFRNLFVKSEEVEITKTPAGAKTEEVASGTFITEQSLVTFAGATFVSGMASGVLLRLFPTLNELYTAAAVAFVVGLLVYGITVSDPRIKKQLVTPRDKWIAGIVGVLNAVYLVAISIGVFEVIEQAIAGQ
jgi:hypothetical protein